MIKVLLAGLMAVCLAACESSLPKDQAHFAKGYKAYEKGDFYTALLYLKPLVEEGHPAAELLMAKMYANGEGVPTDEGKAELLRNLAAVKIYSKPLPPGAVRPANATLKAMQDRIDYYAEGGSVSGKNPPVQNISQLLTSLDLNSIKELAQTDFESPTPSVTENAPSPEPAPMTSEPAVEAPTAPRAPPPQASPAAEAIDTAGARRSDHISLSMLRRSADEGDPLAMDLLSTAYAKGYYGLPHDPAQAAEWKQRAREKRRQLGPARVETENSEESVPYGRLGLMMAAGLVLVGGGAWKGMKRRKKKG